MCGIVGVVSHSPVNQLIYDSLLLLQHRGQDAAGIATANGSTFHMYKANGMVRDVFRTRNMRSLPGTAGIGQVRYPTAGSASSECLPSILAWTSGAVAIPVGHPLERSCLPAAVGCAAGVANYL